MVLITTADGTKGIDAIPYTTLKGDLRKSVRALKTTLKTTDVLGRKAGDEENTSTTEEPSEEPAPAFVDWENAKGKVITASVQEVKDGKVHFLLKNGKSVWYQISKLSEASQAKLSELK
jgi:hypothetical protein